MKIQILTPRQMKELSNYGLDTSDASLYINDVTADDIDNGQLLVNLFPNDGSRKHEYDHSHVIFIYSIKDALRKIPSTNVQITNLSGMHCVNVYAEEMYNADNAITDADYIISIAQDIIALCDTNKPWQLSAINEILNCIYRLKNNIAAYPETQIKYKEELIIEALNVSQKTYYTFIGNTSIQYLINKIIESLNKMKQSYNSIVFSYKSTKYNEVLFECMKYFLSNGKQLKRLS